MLIWKKLVVAYLMYILTFPWRECGKPRNISEYHSLGRDLNRRPSEYEADVLITRP